MVGGSRWSVAPLLVDWVLEYGAVGATVDYRLAPDFADPVPVEDCYAGFEWFTRHADMLGFDPRWVPHRGSERRRRAERRHDVAAAGSE
jgi:acetyl esterase/lipase